MKQRYSHSSFLKMSCPWFGFFLFAFQIPLSGPELSTGKMPHSKTSTPVLCFLSSYHACYISAANPWPQLELHAGQDFFSSETGSQGGGSGPCTELQCLLDIQRQRLFSNKLPPFQVASSSLILNLRTVPPYRAVGTSENHLHDPPFALTMRVKLFQMLRNRCIYLFFSLRVSP